MKYLCESCERLVEPAGFRADAESFALRCPRCGAETGPVPGARIEVTTASVSPVPALSLVLSANENPRPVVVPFAQRPPQIEREEPEPPPPPMPVPAAERCPKCATPKLGRTACARCGLVFELYKPEQDAMPQSSRRDFARLVDGWGQPDVEKLLDAQDTVQLGNLGRLALHHLADFPGDDRASAILERVKARTLALASAAAQSESIGRAGSSQGKLITIGAVALMALGAMALLVSLLSKLG